MLTLRAIENRLWYGFVKEKISQFSFISLTEKFYGAIFKATALIRQKTKTFCDVCDGLGQVNVVNLKAQALHLSPQQKLICSEFSLKYLIYLLTSELEEADLSLSSVSFAL